MAHSRCSCIHVPTADGSPLAGWRLAINLPVLIAMSDGSHAEGTCLGIHPDREGEPNLVLALGPSGTHGWYPLDHISEVQIAAPSSVSHLADRTLALLDEPGEIPLDGEVELTAAAGEHVRLSITIRRSLVRCAPDHGPAPTTPNPAGGEQGRASIFK